ncbi:PhnA domain-containing protein [sulfur-oxidizing endosymbiont of Gigantopelta aegis]|uniref:PhnA domain-containing protein n=1 Tax=sulfur-oxidizing endosymbiont of Gigantopelta aegis TaxID=2794934 RepID=UPI0018DDE6EF|nr:alkylphosphonate utilization protein [sulfur-oxidizing endosymbiont of Gigantopelta aegis]
MSIEKTLHERSDSKCELCGATNDLQAYEVSGSITVNSIDAKSDDESNIILCQTCSSQIDNPDKMDINHWRCLNDSMWSQVPAVQVMAWRMLTRLSAEGWPQDLLDMLYLDDAMMAWAQATGEGAKQGDSDDEPQVIHKDSNGVQLEAGDTVVIIKDLNVKGTSFVAKRGTAVRGISLVADNPEHIEGRVNGQQIVILTQFVKKS